MTNNLSYETIEKAMSASNNDLDKFFQKNKKFFKEYKNKENFICDTNFMKEILSTEEIIWVENFFFLEEWQKRKRDLSYKTISKKEIVIPKFKIKDFKDTFFNIEGQDRENSAILRLFDSDDIFFLCNDTYHWIALNVSFDICGEKEQGDIDILISMIVSDEEKNIYRAFEVKASKIFNSKDCKSLKLENKELKKIKAKLKKMIDFGSEQTFLLFIFLLEAGYHKKHDKLPDILIKKMNKTIEEIKDDNFGCICTFLEQQKGCDEKKTPPIKHTPKCLLETKGMELKKPMKTLVEYIDKFWEENHNKYSLEVPIIVYCNKCKRLNILDVKNFSNTCNYCGKKILNNNNLSIHKKNS